MLGRFRRPGNRAFGPQIHLKMKSLRESRLSDPTGISQNRQEFFQFIQATTEGYGFGAPTLGRTVQIDRKIQL